VRPNVGATGDARIGEVGRRQTRDYFAMVTGVDEQFGRILDSLEEQGLAEDTLVVFLSDHGNCLGSNGVLTKNTYHEESMRVPLLVRWPGVIPARRDDLLLSVPDLYPTLLDLMGLADAVPAEVQGRSHARVFRGEEGERPTAQLYFRVPIWEPALGLRGVRTERYTLVVGKAENGTTRTILFDNLEDPYQLDDIASEQSEIAQELYERELEPRLRSLGDPWLDS
jgi:arylsulfatase A-like enzyme